MNESINNAKETIIEILQNHNVKEVDFDSEMEEYEDLPGFYDQSPIEGIGWDKDGSYVATFHKIELVEKDGKYDIQPYATAQIDGVDGYEIEGDHVEFLLETYLGILEYLEFIFKD